MENTVITATEAKKMTEENLFSAPDFIKAMDRVQKATARGEYRAQLYIKDVWVHETLKSLGYKVVVNGYNASCGHWTDIFWNTTENIKESCIKKESKMKKFECKGCVHRKCVADVDQSEIPKYCALKGYLVSSWREVKEEEPKLPKLTTEVFNRPDCPVWARYAVINHKGRLSFFADKPKFEGEDYGCWSCDNYGYTHINNTFFDPSDWQNSLIERFTIHS